jgi:hypothetical protein
VGCVSLTVFSEAVIVVILAKRPPKKPIIDGCVSFTVYPEVIIAVSCEKDPLKSYHRGFCEFDCIS